MKIRICSNIAKYRKETGITQAELAEYLGVSPQAVSKWEQEISIPDIYLIPPIASFFNISIDMLFGTTDIDTTDVFVSKYSIQRNDKNYKEAKDAIDNLLENDPNHLTALGNLCKLEYQRSLEFLHKSKKACEQLQRLASGKDEYFKKWATVQLIREDGMLGNYNSVEEYRKKFEENRTVEDFNYLLIALGELCQYEQILRLGDEYIDSFNRGEQQSIYPNLMEAAYMLGNLESVQRCFQVITEDKENTPQIFNAWWLLWRTYQKLGHEIEAERCKQELLVQLPKQNYNEYIFEEMRRCLEEEGAIPEEIF